MQVEPFRPIHLDLLRTRGIQPSQVSHVPVSYASFARPPGPALTAMDNGNVILCGGICLMAPGMGLLWAVLAHDAGHHMLRLHRAVRRFIDSEPIRRLEATVEDGFAPGCRWLDLLGFEFEGTMRGYGDAGETHLRYARITTGAL